MRAVDEDDEDNFPLKYLQQRQGRLQYICHNYLIKGGFSEIICDSIFTLLVSAIVALLCLLC